MLIFHLNELKFRFIYFFISLLLTFLILFIYKIELFNLLIPLNIIFTNILEVFWYSIFFILFISFILNLPIFYSYLLYYLKTGVYKNEYFYIKQIIVISNFIIFISFVFLQFILLPYFINWSNFYNSEELSMQISLSSYINFIINLYYLLIFNNIFIFFIFLFKFSRIKIYLILLCLITLFSPPDLFSFIIIFILYFLFIEFILFLIYLYKLKGL